MLMYVGSFLIEELTTSPYERGATNNSGATRLQNNNIIEEPLL